MNSLRTYLTEAYAIDNSSILRILTQNKQINKSDPDYNYYEKLANWANSSGKQQKLKNIDLNTIKLTDRGLLEKRKLITRYTTLGHLLLALKNLMDQEGKYTPSSEISRLVQQTTLDILAGLSGINSRSEPQEEPEDDELNDEDIPDNEAETDESRLYAGMDWTAEKARRLENIKEPTSAILDKFYDDYYSVEYAGRTKSSNGDPNIVVKLKSLDKILIPEFNALGYNPDVNPFAQFLKILIEKKRDIFDKLNTNTYGAIHNAFIAKHVTGNMLGNYPEAVGTENILFCNDLYNHNGLEIVKYLSLQRQVFKEHSKSKHKDVGNIISRVFIQQATTGNSYSEKVNNLLSDNSIVSAISSNAKIKSLLEIQELFNYLFEHEADDVDEIDQIVKEAIAQKVVPDMVYCITDQAKLEDTGKAAIIEWLQEIEYNKSDKQLTTCKRILLGRTINKSVAVAVINKLVRYFNKNIRRKDSDK